jgi:hypothetical protein
MKVDHGDVPKVMEFAGIAKWMRMHEVHRIGTAKSMAGISHPGELTGDTA